jgi:hypothetical protein
MPRDRRGSAEHGVAYWFVVAGVSAAHWYRSGGNHLVNRGFVAGLILLGGLLAGVPALVALGIGIAGAVWAAMPMQWDRAIGAAGIAFGAGVACWAVGVSLG